MIYRRTELHKGDVRLINHPKVTTFVCKGDRLAQHPGEGGRPYVL
jgi:hypothetical protein